MISHHAIAALFLSLFAFTLGAASMQALYLYELTQAQPAQQLDETAVTCLSSDTACSPHRERENPIALAQAEVR